MFIGKNRLRLCPDPPNRLQQSANYKISEGIGRHEFRKYYCEMGNLLNSGKKSLFRISRNFPKH